MITAREDVLNVRFDHSGASNNRMGMRELQARVYDKRDSQYLLIKAPPASGKSRALMYVALDKVHHQGCNKVIVAVPQMAIGGSFRSTNLTSSGFWCDWEIDPQYDLCYPGGESQKVKAVNKFIADPEAHFLVCSHPTLIYFYDQLEDKSVLNHALIAVDEFHHVSADSENRLGSVLHSLMKNTTAHIVAMTGSYFRGDSVPVLEPKDEELFDKVTYTYYEQLKSYKYLKSLGIDYAFYTGVWVDAIHDILDTTKKSIIYIPSVNSRESTHDKIDEVGKLLDAMGDVLSRDADSGIYTLQTEDGRTIKVADLVSDQVPGSQHRTLDYLRHAQSDKDAIDIIIALGMAKEGFDWPWCEQVLTIGYRNSLTEVVQIIGRATRDAPGKEHAQYTNLIANPDASLSDVESAVNSLLKAISLSLLMEQVLAPNVHFRVRRDEEQGANTPDHNGGDKTQPDLTININDDEKAPLSPAVKDILENDIPDIVEKLLTSESNVKEALFSNGQGINELLWTKSIPQIIREMFAERGLSDSDIDTLATAVLTQLNIPAALKRLIAEEKANKPDSNTAPESETTPNSNSGDSKGDSGNGGNGGNSGNGDGSGSKESADSAKPRRTHNDVVIDNNALLKFSEKFINVDDLDINLILAINPFQDAHDFISRNLDEATFHAIQDQVVAKRAKVSEEEACLLWPALNKFIAEHKRVPNPNSVNDYEKRLAEVYAYLRQKKAQKLSQQAATSSTV